MKNRHILFVIALILVFSHIGAAQEVCDEFGDHVRKVYIQKIKQRGNRAESLAFQSDAIKIAQIYGYALGNQQQYVKGSADEHFYKKCVQQNREFIKTYVTDLAREYGWPEAFTRGMESRALSEFERATTGFLDGEMEMFTGVRSKDAPNFVAAPNKVCDKFEDHIRDVYFQSVSQRLTREEKLALAGDVIKHAQVVGYALGNQLQYINRGSSADDFYKKCEQQARQFIKTHVTGVARFTGWSEAFTRGMESRALREFEAAIFGLYDTEMAKFTGVKQKDAPNFFVTPGRTGIQAGNQAQNQTGTGQPGVRPGAPPPAGSDALGLDRVAGDYDIVDKYNNDKRGTLRVLGTMDEATFDFRLESQGRLWWHWEGSLKLIRGRPGMDKVRTLRGPGRSLLHRQSAGCEMKIKKGADNAWHAFFFNLGGNSWKLVPR